MTKRHCVKFCDDCGTVRSVLWKKCGACGSQMIDVEAGGYIDVHDSPQEEPARDRDNCAICLGTQGGTPGNGNIIDGIIVCDYCHVAMRKHNIEAPDIGTFLRVRMLLDLPAPASGGGPSDEQINDAIRVSDSYAEMAWRIRSLFAPAALPDPKEVARKIYDALATNADRWMASLDIGEQEPGTLGISQRDAIVRVLTEAYGPQGTQEEPR